MTSESIIMISKSISRGTLRRQKVRHNIKKYLIMSKMHNFRNKEIRDGIPRPAYNIQHSN